VQAVLALSCRYLAVWGDVAVISADTSRYNESSQSFQIKRS
jgi:hypothetical protein